MDLWEESNRFVSIPSGVSHDWNMPCSENFSFQSKCELRTYGYLWFQIWGVFTLSLFFYVCMLSSLLCSSGSALQIKLIMSTISKHIYNLSQSLKEQQSTQSTRNINFTYLHICVYILCVDLPSVELFQTQQQFVFAPACRETRLRGEKSWLTGFICSQRTLAGVNTNQSRCINGRLSHRKRRRNRTCC